MTPSLLIAAGRALHGLGWQRGLAEDLGVSRRTILRWSQGQWPVPDGIAAELGALLQARGAELRDLARQLRRAA